ncbi:MAG: Gfo/Idh/MocA family oxidoreductase [Pseudomonadota bacterium]
MSTSQSNGLKCAVIGTGYLGKFHADKYAALPECQLTAIVDVNPEAAAATAAKHGCQGLTDYRALLGKVDAVSIAVPTSLHFEVARDFLMAGTHVLVEKPVTTTVAEADELIRLARENNRVLMVGHLERFNPAILALEGLLDQPRFIESTRLAPFKPRATDVSVVLDLMIHDIDIILDIVGSEITHIEASGATVLTSDIDIANARLTFANGCVANVTASRISLKSERKMRLFQKDAYLSVDFQNRVLASYRKGEGEMFPGVPNFVPDEQRFENGDALQEEIRHFVDCATHGRAPRVPGEAGRRALATAEEITALLQRSN